MEEKNLRPDPDALLKEIEKDDGKWKIKNISRLRPGCR